MSKPIVIDTDMAVDDWLAIAYLLQRQDVEIRAIAVTADTAATCETAVRNAMSILALAGKPNIPVAAGRPVPLHANGLQPGWRARIDSVLGIELPSNPNEPSTLGAVDLLQQAFRQPGDKPTLLTLGPLTNIAELLNRDPNIADRVAMTYIMGGAVDAPGNVEAGIVGSNDTAEWNIFLHPPAAAAVFASRLPITLIPLDCTNTAPLTRRFYDELAANRTTPVTEFVYEVLTHEKASIEAGGWYFWDPLAAVAITHPQIIDTDPMLLSVVTTGPESGRTRRDPAGHEMAVATRADAGMFEHVFIGALNGQQF
ncbi:MAG: nucleoside hydrolase [Devosia sp.]